MKTRRLTFFLILLAIIMVAAMYAFYAQGNRYSWVENYKEKNKGPYGTQVLYALLKEYFPGESLIKIQKPLSQELPAKPAKPSSYVFVGPAPFYDSASRATLLKFVSNGNYAFIASKEIPESLIEELNPEWCVPKEPDDPLLDFTKDTQALANLLHPDLKLPEPVRLRYLKPYPRNSPPPAYYWTYFRPDYFCDREGGFVELGKLNRRHVNFVRISHKKGWIYLHTNPVFFSNLSLLEKDRVAYVEGALSHLPPGTIYWDQFSKIPGRNMGSDGGMGNRQFADRSPLDYILRQPALAAAWYLLVAIGLLFLIFRTKRRQQPVPVIPPNKNTSLEFILAIGRLNFLQQDHKKTALQKMKLFLQFARERFMLPTRELDDEFVTLLSAKAQIDPQAVRHLILMYQNIQRGSIVTENTLIEFSQRLDHLTQHCKQTHSLPSL